MEACTLGPSVDGIHFRTSRYCSFLALEDSCMQIRDWFPLPLLVGRYTHLHHCLGWGLVVFSVSEQARNMSQKYIMCSIVLDYCIIFVVLSILISNGDTVYCTLNKSDGKVHAFLLDGAFCGMCAGLVVSSRLWFVLG